MSEHEQTAHLLACEDAECNKRVCRQHREAPKVYKNERVNDQPKPNRRDRRRFGMSNGFMKGLR